MRCNIVITLGFLPKRNAGIVRHHRYCKGKFHPFSFHVGNGLCRIKMRHHNHIYWIFFDILSEIFSHTAIYIVYRGFPGNPAYTHSQLIDNAKKPGSPFHDLHVSISHQPGHSLSCKSEIIQHIGFISLLKHCLCNGSAC